MFSLNHHLDSDEKIIQFFRPSRKAYIFQYILWILLFLSSIFFAIYKPIGTAYFIFWDFINLAAMLVGIFSLIMLIRLEYRIWSRRYALTDERLLYSRGIFSESFRSAPYARVTDIGFEQTFFDKIMDTGTLHINTAGTDNFEIRYRKISRPLEIKRMINDGQGEDKKHDSDTASKEGGQGSRI